MAIRSAITLGRIFAAILVATTGRVAIAAGHTPELRAVQFAPISDNIRIVLEFDADTAFRTSSSASPNRVELTFDTLNVTPRAMAGTGFGLIRLFHVERAPGGRTRIVFDLTRAAIVIATSIQPGAPGQPVRAMVELAPGSPIAAASAPVRPVRSDGVFPSRFHAPLVQAGIPTSSTPVLVAAVPPSALLPGAEAVAAVRPAPKTPTLQTIASELAKRTIIVDPGHGGVDPGADSVAGYREKEVTLATARVLARVLEATGRYRVLLTRNSDVYLKLHDRVVRARNAHGDLFVSLHADSMGGPLFAVADHSARGASVYTLSETASDAESERYAQRENRADQIGDVDLRDQSDDVAGILVDLTMRETINNENRFAEMLVQALQQGGIGVLPRAPHRSAGFAVLKSPDIPSVLVEMGYLSDIADARDLAAPVYQQRIAQSIAQAIDRYFAAVETADR